MVALFAAGESKTDNDDSLKQFEQIYWQFGQKWILQLIQIHCNQKQFCEIVTKYPQ